MTRGSPPLRTAVGDRLMSGSAPGLFDIPGASAAREVAGLAAEQRDLAGALRRSYARQRNYQAAALSEPMTATTV